MRIAIDCRGLRKPPSGIPNYIVSAINTISGLYPTWKLYLLTNEAFHPELDGKILKRENIIILVEPLFIAKKVAITWFVFKVYSILQEIKPDFFWCPGFIMPPFIPQNIKTVITVPDMVFKQFKQTMSFGNRFIFELFHDRSIKKADLIWAISHYTRQEIEKTYPTRKCKDIFVGLSIDNNTFKSISVSEAERQKLLTKYKLTHKLLLFVGTVEPRKNLSFLLSLMPELSEQEYSLLVVGAKGWGKTDIKEIIETPGYPKKSVVFSGFLSTEELVKIYNIASVYVSTSKNEGFGLPQLEAMACGCPVVSSHNSAMIEIVEGAGETVKGWNQNDWLYSINKVYENREAYIKSGFLRASQYSWESVINNLSENLYRIKG